MHSNTHTRPKQCIAKITKKNKKTFLTIFTMFLSPRIFICIPLLLFKVIFVELWFLWAPEERIICYALHTFVGFANKDEPFSIGRIKMRSCVFVRRAIAIEAGKKSLTFDLSISFMPVSTSAVSMPTKAAAIVFLGWLCVFFRSLYTYPNLIYSIIVIICKNVV